MSDSVHRLRSECLTLYFALRHPQTPWYARALIIIVVGYAYSPVDLIPDFIPILGQLDDLILVPLGVWLALKLIPECIIQESKAKALAHIVKPVQPGAIVIVITTWLILLALGILLVYQLVG